MQSSALRSIVLLALFAVIVGAAPRASAQGTDYVIGPKDVLTITVWDQADLSAKYTVEADGSFTFPLIGRVKAGGLTLKQVEEDIRKRLADGYFKNPQVSVAMETYVSQRVFVVGEVRQPGPQPLTGDMTLIEALSRAGSTLPSAGSEVVIVHAPKGQSVVRAMLPGETDDTVRVDLKELQSGGQAKNVALRDGDTIYVPKAETIYVSGQVKSPGAYELRTRETTVLQALSLAGGITDRGASNRVKIMRVVDGKKVEIKVKDLAELVRPGDTIVVPERYF